MESPFAPSEAWMENHDKHIVSYLVAELIRRSHVPNEKQLEIGDKILDLLKSVK